MALLASLRETAGNVIWVGRPLKILQMTGNARRGRQIESIVCVTIGTRARRNSMSARQRKSHCVVIKLRIHPIVGAMTLIACGRVSICHVIWRRSVFEFFCMTRVTHGRHDLKFAVGRVFVAGIAIHGRMRAGERKAIIVLLNLLDRHSPAAHAMTLLAICPKLPLMNVGVTILASLPHVIEHRLDVTLDTGEVAMQSAKRIMSLIVIEFGYRPNGLPALSRVAVLARHVQVTVRTACARAILIRCARKRGECKKQKCCQAFH